MKDNQPLIVALPSKGRLLEPVQVYFADAGAAIRQNARDYTGRIEGIAGCEVMFLAASEIASALIEGRAHLGITGEDLLREVEGERNSGVAAVTLLEPLGFGHADVVVAVPQAWIDVTAMADLDDVCHEFHARHRRRLRIATKYQNLTRAFFRDRGLSDYLIVHSAGATEGAPAAGMAEAIVDITTSGATLQANQLKVLGDGVILRSQAHLAASRTAPWGETSKAAATELLTRIAARDLAQSMLIIRVRMDIGVDGALKALEAAGARVATRPPLNAPHAEAVVLTPRRALGEAVGVLRRASAMAAITVQSSEYVYLPDPPLLKRLALAWA